MIKVNSNDSDRLHQYQIVCHHVRKTENNWIFLPEAAATRGLLTFSIGGDKNEITITGSLLPIGTIHLVESASRVEICCTSDAVESSGVNVSDPTNALKQHETH